MCCNKNRTNAGAGCRRANASHSQRSAYSQDTTSTSTSTSTSRCHQRSQQSPCRRGGLISLLTGLIKEQQANRAVVVDDRMDGDRSWDKTMSHHEVTKVELETNQGSGMRDGDGVHEKTELLDDDHDREYDHVDDDESVREAAELPSYEAAVKSGWADRS